MKSAVLRVSEQQYLDLLLTETAVERMQGLFKADIAKHDGLWIIPCNSVHTFAMKAKLDLVYLSKSLKIVKIVENISPWRLSMALASHSVLELHGGAANRIGLQLDQTLMVE